MEQVSHHPPISYGFMKCDEFTIYGNFTLNMDMGLNSATGSNFSTYHILFPNGNHFEYLMPEG